MAWMMVVAAGVDVPWVLAFRRIGGNRRRIALNHLAHTIRESPSLEPGPDCHTIPVGRSRIPGGPIAALIVDVGLFARLEGRAAVEGLGRRRCGEQANEEERGHANRNALAECARQSSLSGHGEFSHLIPLAQGRPLALTIMQAASARVSPASGRNRRSGRSAGSSHSCSRPSPWAASTHFVYHSPSGTSSYTACPGSGGW